MTSLRHERIEPAQGKVSWDASRLSRWLLGAPPAPPRPLAPSSLSFALSTGFLAVLPWVMLSLARSPESPPTLIAGALVTAVAAGGALGLVGQFARTRPALVWLYVGLACLASYPSRWAIAQPLSLLPALRDLIHLAGSAGLVWMLSRRAWSALELRRFSAGFGRMLGVSLFLIATLLTHHLSHLIGPGFALATLATWAFGIRL